MALPSRTAVSMSRTQSTDGNNSATASWRDLAPTIADLIQQGLEQVRKRLYLMKARTSHCPP